MATKKRRRKGRPSAGAGYPIVAAGSSDTRPLSVSQADRSVDRCLNLFSLDSLVTRAHEMTAHSFMQSLRAPAGEELVEHYERCASVIRARRTVREAIVRRAGRSPNGAEMTLQEFERAANLVWDWIFAGEIERLDTEPDALHVVMQRIIASQYEDQAPLNTLPRHVALARRTIKVAESRGLQLSTLFSDTFGLAFEELLKVSLHVAACAGASSSIPAAGIALSDNTTVDLALLPQFWEMCALDYEEFAEYAQNPQVQFADLESYGLSPTISWPILRRTDGAYVVPVMHDLIYRVGRSFPFDARQAAGRSNVDLLDDARGRAFETFVGDILRGTSGAGSVRHADEVLHATAEGKRCDWICIDGNGGRTTLVETKAAHLPLKTAVSPTPENRSAYIGRKGGIADAVAQIDDTARAIRNGHSHLSPRTKLMGLVVIDGPQVLLNDPATREAVTEVLEARGRPKPAIRYQVAHSDGLVQLVLSASAGASMWEQLHTKHIRRPDRYADMSQIGLPPEASSMAIHPALGAMADELREIWADMLPATG
ncbi:MAG: hypothetical protein OXC71_10230 [Chloroflexi bacterium]|nr:hypothetical protein [Chloroflexota bacterium]